MPQREPEAALQRLPLQHPRIRNSTGGGRDVAWLSVPRIVRAAMSNRAYNTGYSVTPYDDTADQSSRYKPDTLPQRIHSLPKSLNRLMNVNNLMWIRFVGARRRLALGNPPGCPYECTD